MNKPHVVVGLSGGVDSAVSAWLLQQQGYRVQALFMKNWEQDDQENYCHASVDRADAQAVCDQLSIPLHHVNFAKEYWERVFQEFLKEYQAGRTPNPDIVCNKEIKFKLFLNYALAMGADYIATGHYARKFCFDDQQQLHKSYDHNKDQTYFLYTLTQDQLAKTLFPLAKLSKPKVRELATEIGLPNHAKKDSTGICFIGERKFTQFLQTYLAKQPGPIQTTDGHTLGEHNSLMYYTLGQRRGLHIGGQKNSSGAWYVSKKDQENNRLIVVQGKDHPDLYARRLSCRQLHWIAQEKPAFPLQCRAKTRYRQRETECIVTHAADQNYYIEFMQSQWAITPGQSVVFYQNDHCLGGGVIDTVF